MPTTAEELARRDVDTVLHRAAERLADKYTGIFSPETIDRVVNESYVALYRTARIHRHLPALAEHFAGDRLAALAHAKGAIASPVTQAYPKPLTDDVVRAADVVVTMGCGDACPVLPGKRYYDWAIDDPAGQSRAAVRRIPDDIDTRVRALLAELVDQHPGATA